MNMKTIVEAKREARALKCYPPPPPWTDVFGGYSYAQLRYIAERAAEYAAYTRIDLGRPFTEEEREKVFSRAIGQANRDFEDAGWNLRLVGPVERHAIKPRTKNLSTCQRIKI